MRARSGLNVTDYLAQAVSASAASAGFRLFLPGHLA